MPALGARAQPGSPPSPTADLRAPPHPHLRPPGPLCLEYHPATCSTRHDSVPSFKARAGGSSPGKPAQIPPRQGTVQPPQDLTRCPQGRSLIPCSSLLLPSLPLALLPPLHSPQAGPPSFGPLLCLKAVVCPACAVCASALCSGWPFLLRCPPPGTLWPMCRHPTGPSPSVSCKRSPPQAPMHTHWPQKCTRFCACSSSLKRDVASVHPGVPEPAGMGRGRLGLGLGSRGGGCSCGTTVCGALCRAVSAPGGRAWEQAPLQRRREPSPPRPPGPRCPPGSAQNTGDPQPCSVLQWSVTAPWATRSPTGRSSTLT